mmetsp:Transcript_15014/g.30975  ORF Transcript_15014/g.30975 Transcript_15014/m.30975 type:complete len:85 (-) Transcript_15014:164-418(-)
MSHCTKEHHLCYVGFVAAFARGLPLLERGSINPCLCQQEPLLIHMEAIIHLFKLSSTLVNLSKQETKPVPLTELVAGACWKCPL